MNTKKTGTSIFVNSPNMCTHNYAKLRALKKIPVVVLLVIKPASDFTKILTTDNFLHTVYLALDENHQVCFGPS